MYKELISAGRPYLWAFYYALFILFILHFISGFRFIPVGIIFLISLLLKSYTGTQLIMDFFYRYKNTDKFSQYKKQIKLNSAILGSLVLMDILLLIHLPKVFRQTYTLSAFVLFLLVSGFCIVSRWKSNFTDVYVTETTSSEMQSRQNK
jgi:hypothetical protein